MYPRVTGLLNGARRNHSTNVYYPVLRNTLQNRNEKGPLTTPELLVKYGYVRQPNAGLVDWLPLGLDTERNIENIIHNRLKEKGLIEVSMSAISHSSVWEKTNRWQNNELFKLADEYCLAATCEEEVTELVKEYARSYKKLPMIVYQINRKYRNELRARAGLLRGKEFIMKDAYSFDVNEKEALKSFDLMNEIYRNIFEDLKVPFVSANADSGSMGGDLSLEWHFVHERGEDILLRCDRCEQTSNVEKATFKSPISETTGDVEICKSADAKYFVTKDNMTLVVAYYPSGKELKDELLLEEVDDLDLSIAHEDIAIERFLAESNGENEGKYMIRIMDPQVQAGTDLPDLKVNNYSKSRMTTLTFDSPITVATEGDICSSCEQGHLHESHGIEVGHTFHLGDKYSKPLGAQFSDENGQKQYYSMGCYGIGVSRLVGAIAECTRDDLGLRWPAAVAPRQVTLVVSKQAYDEERGEEAVQQIIEENILKDLNYKLEIDSRDDISFGTKLNESKKIGIPLQLVVGKNFPRVQIEVRGSRFSSNVEDYDYLKLFGEKSKEFGWEISEDNKGSEIHLVDIKHVNKVIESLLKDL